MAEYPKQMRHKSSGVLDVLAEPNGWGKVPVRYVNGSYDVRSFCDLSPLPSPDDPVEVVVPMTRRQRDRMAGKARGELPGEWAALIAACKAHRDAEEAEARG